MKIKKGGEKLNKKFPRRLLLLAAALLVVFVLPACPAIAEEPDYIVKLKDGSSRFEVVSAAEMRRLYAAGELEWYEQDSVMTILDDDPPQYYASDKWDLALIGADIAFAKGYLGQGVRVAVIDSGVNAGTFLDHCLQSGHNYMEGADEDDTADKYGHGTLVAGLIAGSGDDGYVGAAPEADIVPLKITDGKSVMTSTVCSAIYSAVDDYGCNVINLSVGINSDSTLLAEAIGYAEEKGVTVVAAAGNNGTAALYYPAAYDTVIGVGSVDRNGEWYYRSNYNSSVFLTAPGVNVKTAGNLGGYVTSTGTSFSTPYAAAAAAVLLSVDGELTPADIREILAETAVDKGDAGRDDKYGYGLLDIAAGVIRAEKPPCRLAPETGPAESIRNTTAETLECIYYLARYDEDGRFLSVSAFTLTIAPGESAALQAPDEAAGWAQFFCSAAKFAPLAEARRP